MTKQKAWGLALKAARLTGGRMLLFTPKNNPNDWDVKPAAEETIKDHVRAVVWPDGGSKMRFECQVYETVVLRRRYTVEADSVEEAHILANQGETVSEQTISTLEVINREVSSCTPVS